MREIKFRIFSSGIMRYNPRIKFIEDNINYEVYGARPWDDVENVEGFINLNYLFVTEEEKDSFYMLFTGVKDKNGKEIYEGDIVEIEIYGTVIYREIKWFDDESRFDFYPFVIKSDCYSTNYSINNLKNNMNIIGNIYENSNLKDNYWRLKDDFK